MEEFYLYIIVVYTFSVFAVHFTLTVEFDMELLAHCKAPFHAIDLKKNQNSKYDITRKKVLGKKYEIATKRFRRSANTYPICCTPLLHINCSTDG